MSAGLNIAALARRTGVAADTLRKWEQRYGVLQPARTPGGQRRYSELDVDRVEWLRARLSEGYRIGEAAALLGGGEWQAARTPAELVKALLEAVARLDTPRLAQLLDQTLALDPRTGLADVLEPLLERIGDGWERGQLSVVHEHVATQAVRTRLSRRLGEARGGVRGRAVLACVPAEEHDVGLLMLGILLQADGWEVVLLGPNTPLPGAAAVAAATAAKLLCLSATMREHVVALPAGPLGDGTHVVLGGNGADAAAARRLGAVHLREHAGDAVDWLRVVVA